MSLLPITAKLNPFAGAQNWAYLMQSAAITRLLTGAARVWENRPSALQDPNLTQNEKRQACLERFFVEIIGTAGYLGFLHLGQDIIAKTLDPNLKKHLNQLVAKIEDPASGLDAQQAQKVKRALVDVYAGDSQSLIERYLYGYKTHNKSGKTQVNLGQMKKVLNENDLFHYVRTSVPLDEFTSALRHKAAISVLGGIAVSALFGGLVTQWLNDRVFAPVVRKVLNKRSGETAPSENTPESAAKVGDRFNGLQTTAPIGATAAIPLGMHYSTMQSQVNPTTAYMPPRAWSSALGGLPR